MKKVSYMNLKIIRKKIDGLDMAILKLISKRLNLARSIGLIKKTNRIGVVDNKREREILGRIVTLSKSLGLDGKMTEKIWKIIIRQSKFVQNNKS